MAKRTRATGSSGATSRKNTPIEIGDILRDLKKTSPLGAQLDQAVIWERWPEIAGTPLYMHARPVSVKKGVLKVEAESSVWMNRFAFRSESIIRRINQIVQRRLIKEIFLTLIEEGKNLAPEEDVP